MDFLAIAKLLASSPELASTLKYEDLVTYIDLVGILKPKLSRWYGPYQDDPPERLPVNVHEFLKLCLGMKDETAKIAWDTLRNLAWSASMEADGLMAKTRAHTKYIKLFLKHGTCRGLGKL
jgi:hypothetical protein